MSIGLSFDHNAPDPVAFGLRRLGIDVLLAREDGAAQFMDERMLVRASVLGRVLFTHDDDFLVIVADWQRNNREFVGVAYTA